MHGGFGRDTMYLGPRDKVWAGPGNDRASATHARRGWINADQVATRSTTRPQAGFGHCEIFVKMADPTW